MDGHFCCFSSSDNKKILMSNNDDLESSAVDIDKKVASCHFHNSQQAVRLGDNRKVVESAKKSTFEIILQN